MQIAETSSWELANRLSMFLIGSDRAGQTIIK